MKQKIAVGITVIALLAACTEPSGVPTDLPDGLKPDFAIVLPGGSPVTLSNGLPTSDPDHFRVTIQAGGRSTVMVQDGGDVLFEMFGALDLGALGVHRFDISDPQGPVLLAPNVAQTAANILTGSGEVTVLMTSIVLPGAEHLATTYQINSDFDLGGSRMFEYVDLDILGFSGDAFSFTGSIATGDLVMRQEDGGVIVDRVANAEVTGFASDFFPALLTDITSGGFDPPPGGSVAAVFGDITSAFEFELSGTAATPATAIGSAPAVGRVLFPDMDVLSVVNVTSNGAIPVALLSDDEFDAMDVDVTTLAFGPGNAGPAHDPDNQGNLHRRDVDNDGDTDRVLHFRTQEAGLSSDDTEACMSGVTRGVDFFIACDAIQTRMANGRGLEGITGRLTGATFFVNHAVCGGGSPFEFFLNEESLGSAAPTSPCVCNDDELEVSFEGKNALRAWNPQGGNTVTVRIADTPVFGMVVGYIRAEFEATGHSATFPVFDATGGDASPRDLCDGFVANDEQSEFTVDVR